MGFQRLLVLTAVLAPACGEPTAVWLGPFFRRSGPAVSLSAASNAAATAALLDLHPSSPVTAADSAQVDSLLSPDVFNRPDVVLSLQVVGAPSSWAAAVAAAGAGVLTPLTSDSDAVAASLAPLDGHAVTDACGGECSDAACVSGLLGGDKPLAAEVEALSSATLASLGCFLTSLRAAVASPDAALLLGRLDLSELSTSSVLGAAVLAAAQDVLKAARGDGAATQLVFLDAQPASALSSLRPEGVQRRKLRAAWHSTARHLSQATAPAPAAAASTRDVNAWYAKVAGFGVGIMLLVAIIGTVVALCTLPTGQDTLLYARTKGD